MYFEKGVCNCDPSVPAVYPIASLSKIEPNPHLAKEFAKRYAEASALGPTAEVTVFDLLRPGEAYFRGLPVDEGDEEDVRDSLRAADTYALYREFKREATSAPRHSRETR